MDQGLGYIGAAILGALATNAFQIYRDNEKDKRQKRDDKIRFTNELRGIKHIMLQSKASYYSAFYASESIHSAAHILATRIINYDDILTKEDTTNLPRWKTHNNILIKLLMNTKINRLN